MADSSQKFIARNRAPRVQIEYDVELYGAEKKVQLPFVMGVMSDLVGQSKVAQPSVADRKFLEIDVDNFDDRMKSIAPRAAFSVANTLTGEGNLAIDLTFEKMSDFSPGAIASKVDALKPLLEARTQLNNLMAYMDGKSGAEALIEKILQDTSLLSALSAGGGGDDADLSAALDSLRGVELPTQDVDETGDILADLGSRAPVDAPQTDTADMALASLAAVEIAAPEQDNRNDVLGALAAQESVEQVDNSTADALASLAAVEVGEGTEDDGSDILGDLAAMEVGEETDTSSDDALASLAAIEPAEDDGADILSELAATPVAEDADDSGLDDLAALLGDLEEEDTPEEDSLADILGGLDAPDDSATEEGSTDDVLADLAGPDADEPAEDAGLEDLLGDLTDNDAGDDLDGLFADLEEDAAPDQDESGEDDLDALLTDNSDEADDDGDLDLDDLLGSLDDDDDTAADDLDDLLDGDDDDEDAVTLEEPEFAYGTISADRPDPQKLIRKRFRLAILGDFSGRAARGLVETGDDLAARRAVILDPDTVEDVIESFATELVLPIGRDGDGMSVKLSELDDLHPDELYENVELFSELVGLRKQLQSGVTADHAAKTLLAWGEKHGTRVKPPKPRSGGNAVPADCRLSAFQQLIGDSGNQLGQVSPVQDLLARVVGPHISALPSPDAAAMIGAVDQALSDAMRMVLHHPEFQSLEAQWRSLDLIARSVEDDDTLDVMLYDISAEELAADLAAAEDLSDSGFVRLLTGEPLDEENGRGGYSALIGLYQFEETPPHAELLGRIARVAAHVDAPFFAGMSPAFLAVEKDKLPPVVAKAWDTLRGMPEAGHLGLLAPRFMLRRPYGAKSDPISEFEFEEFTESEGLRGMLWANPVVLAAILLARSFKENGASMGLGQIMSLGGIPFHYVNDRFGDQVALPCTERNIDLDKIAAAQERGFMAVSAIKGRDEIRLTSFNSVAGAEILGPWTGMPAPEPSPPDPKPVETAPADEVDLDDDLDLDDLGLDDLDLDLGDDGDDLDDLLAGFGDDAADDEDEDDEIDADLAALLADL